MGYGRNEEGHFFYFSTFVIGCSKILIMLRGPPAWNKFFIIIIIIIIITWS